MNYLEQQSNSWHGELSCWEETVRVFDFICRSSVNTGLGAHSAVIPCCVWRARPFFCTFLAVKTLHFVIAVTFLPHMEEGAEQNSSLNCAKWFWKCWKSLSEADFCLSESGFFCSSLLKTRVIRVHRHTSLQKAATTAVGYHGDAAHAASTGPEPTPGQSPVSR